MQIILMEKVANLGNLGDVVKVREGYARNYLIPQGKAKRVTPENLAAFEAKRAELERAQAEKLEAAKTQAEKLEGVNVRVARKAGVDGRLFGSVTSMDIADALKAMGHEVEKTEIHMPLGPLKQIGDTPLEVGLHGDVIAHITVSVVAEQ